MTGKAATASIEADGRLARRFRAIHLSMTAGSAIQAGVPSSTSLSSATSHWPRRETTGDNCARNKFGSKSPHSENNATRI
jgi:hypothetical protein